MIKLPPGLVKIFEKELERVVIDYAIEKFQEMTGLQNNRATSLFDVKSGKISLNSAIGVVKNIFDGKDEGFNQIKETMSNSIQDTFSKCVFDAQKRMEEVLQQKPDLFQNINIEEQLNRGSVPLKMVDMKQTAESILMAQNLGVSVDFIKSLRDNIKLDSPDIKNDTKQKSESIDIKNDVKQTAESVLMAQNLGVSVDFIKALKDNMKIDSSQGNTTAPVAVTKKTEQEKGRS